MIPKKKVNSVFEVLETIFV